MREKIAEIIRDNIYCGYEGELIYVGDGVDQILSYQSEEIEKGLLTDGEIAKANITGGQQYMVAVQNSTSIPSLHIFCVRAIAQAQLQKILALLRSK